MRSFLAHHLNRRALLSLLSALLLSVSGLLPAAAQAASNDGLYCFTLTGLYCSETLLLSPDQQLGSGQSVANKAATLKMLSNGNLVLYRNDTGAAIWNTGTGVIQTGGPSPTAATHAVMWEGSLVLYNFNNSLAVWSSGTSGHVAGLFLQPSGDLVIRDENGLLLWQTHTCADPAYCLSQVLTANQELGIGQSVSNSAVRLVMQSDGNLVLYRNDTGAPIWWSGTSGMPATHAIMQADGNFVLYNSDNSVAYFNTGTSGHPGATLNLQGDGNMIVVDVNILPLWQTNTCLFVSCVNL